MRAYRRKMREQGLRPIQIWVPDSSNAQFRRSLRRQVRRLNVADEADALAFIESAADKSA